MKQLNFTLSLIDKLTRPLKQALAMWSVAQTIQGALSPAIEMYVALNDAIAEDIDTT